MSLGGKKTKFSKEETTRQMPVLPDFLQQPIQDLSGRINNLSLQEYSPYGGQRLADFSGDQQAAFAGVRGLQGKYDPLINNASQLAMDLGQGITPEDIQNFMNPYQQNVIDITKRNASTDFDKQLMDLQNSQKEMNAFGGSRSAILESEARKNLGTLLGDIQMQGSSQGYQSAVQAAMANQQLQQSSLAGMLNTASTGMGTDLSGIEALRQTGAQQQALSQAGLDIGYGDYLEQRQWPYQQAQFGLSGLLPIAELTRGSVTKTNVDGSQKEGGGGLGSALGGLASLGLGALGGPMGLAGSLAGGMMSMGMGNLANSIFGISSTGATGAGRAGLPFREGGLVRFANGGPVTMGRQQPQQFARGSILDLLRNSAFSNTQINNAEHFQSIASFLNPEMGKKPIQAIEPMFRKYLKHYSAPSDEPEEDFSKGYKMGEFNRGGLVKYAGGGKIYGLPPQTESISSHILNSIFKQSPDDSFETVKKFFGFGPQEYYDNLRDEKLKSLDEDILRKNMDEELKVIADLLNYRYEPKETDSMGENILGQLGNFFSDVRDAPFNAINAGGKMLSETAGGLSEYLSKTPTQLQKESEENTRNKAIEKELKVLEEEKKIERAKENLNSENPEEFLPALWTLEKAGRAPQPEATPEDVAVESLQSLVDESAGEELGMSIFGSEHNDTKPKEPPVENRIDNYEQEKAKRFGNFWTTVGSKILQTLPENSGFHGLGAGVEAYANSLKEEERYQAELEMAKQGLELKKLNAESLGIQNEIAMANLKFKKQSEPVEQKIRQAELELKLKQLFRGEDDKVVADAVKLVLENSPFEDISDPVTFERTQKRISNVIQLIKNKSAAADLNDPFKARSE